MRFPFMDDMVQATNVIYSMGLKCVCVCVTYLVGAPLQSTRWMNTNQHFA